MVVIRLSNSNVFEGIIPVLVSPYEAEGGLDFAAVDAQLAFLGEAGTIAVAIGYGSEVQRLATSELLELSARVAQHASGMSLIGNLEYTGHASALEEAATLADAGVAALMVRPLHSPGVGSRQLIELIDRFAAESPIPLVLQDAVQHTGIDFAPSDIGQLLTRQTRVAAVKVEPPGAAVKMSRIVDAMSDGAPRILGGAQGVGYVHEVGRGAQGTMPGPATPELFRALHVLANEGRRVEAHRLIARAMPLITLGARNIETFIHVQKLLLARRGIAMSTSLREPTRALDDKLDAEVDEVLEAIAFDSLMAEAASIAS